MEASRIEIPVVVLERVNSGSVEALYESCRELAPPADVSSSCQERTRTPLVVRTCPFTPSAEGQVYANPPKVVEAETIKLAIVALGVRKSVEEVVPKI